MKLFGINASAALESLRKEAKGWLKTLQAGDPPAIARLRTALPQHTGAPTLRAVQLALARERGFPGWSQLKESLQQAEAVQRDLRKLADEMLRQMIFLGDPAIGAELLARHPELAEFDFYTAVATGRLAAVNQHLARDAGMATRTGGPRNWQPLLYFAYSRLPGHAEHAVEIAHALLDHGADPNAMWLDDWGNPFTVLTGVVGEGEGVKPPHPQAHELVALLLERGASPVDTQTLYNNSIVGDDTHWLELLWSASVARGITDRWSALPPVAADGHQPPRQLDYLLGNAVTHCNPGRVAWLLEHGADPGCTHVYTKRPLLEVAQLQGTAEIVALLRHHGASDQPLSPAVAFQIACRQGNFEQARTIASISGEIIAHAEVLMLAAALGRTDLIDLLLERGMPVDIMDEGGVRALHAAVMHDAPRAVAHLLARGALVDTPTRHYGGAMGAAAHFKRYECAKVLAPHSRDVHNLVSLGLVERLAELFAAEPALVNLPHFRRGSTPLFWLPEVATDALHMARFLLNHGADAAARNQEGRTAGEQARLRGQDALAQLLEP
jgi:ankyrin repeat protein